MFEGFRNYWNKITSKNKPQDSDVTFDSDGNIVNIDRDSGKTTHKDAIIKYGTEIVEGAKDFAGKVSDKVIEEVDKNVAAATEAAKDVYGKITVDVKPTNETTFNTEGKIETEAPRVEEVVPEPEPPKVEVAPNIVEAPKVEEPQKVEEPKSEPQKSLVDRIVEVWKK